MDIPEDVREAAQAALRGANIKAHMTGEATDPIECISTAILAERDRATAAERERCLSALCQLTSGPTVKDYEDGYSAALDEAAAAIRNP